MEKYFGFGPDEMELLYPERNSNAEPGTILGESLISTPIIQLTPLPQSVILAFPVRMYVCTHITERTKPLFIHSFLIYINISATSDVQSNTYHLPFVSLAHATHFLCSTYTSFPPPPFLLLHLFHTLYKPIKEPLSRPLPPRFSS